MLRNPASRPALSLAIFSLALLAALAAVGSWMVPDAMAQATGISREEAVSIVTQTELGGSLDAVRLYVHPDPVTPGQTVSDWRRPIYTAPAQGWFLFVDRYPGANWEHPCSYLFVDAATGEILRFDAMAPPELQPELREITNGRDNPPPGVSEAMLERFSQRLRSLPKPQVDRGQAYAFIISGGANQSNNHIRYWNDSAFIYRTLVEYYGYADDHIRVCISDGTNPAPDRSDGTNSPPDLDGDGDPDIEYPATLQYIGQVFNELAATLTPSDQLFIFTTDHGGQESGWDCYLNLWNLEQLRDDQLAAYVDALPCETIICTFEQCFSGGMIDDLSGDGRVIATAAAYNEYSWAMGPDYVYDTFVYHWTSAVAWETPYGQPVDADTNNDGVISMHEAFIYAQIHDNEDETPQYNSTPIELGDMLNLFGNLEGVYLAVDAILIDDDNDGLSQGNGNGVIDFGETVELTVSLKNMGLTDAYDVVGTLSSSSDAVTMIQGVSTYGVILSESSTQNPEPFVFSVAADVQDGEPLELVLSVTEDPESLPLSLTVAAPAYSATVVGINDITGDGDGVADPGETVGVTLRIQNTGGCATPDLSAVLNGGGYFTVDGAPRPVGVIAPGHGVEVGGFSVEISPGCPEIYTGQLGLDLTGPESYAVQATVFFFVGPWFDDAEADMGWTLGLATDTATTGIWERSDPVGTSYNSQQCQPEDDHTPLLGHICFVTGNGSVGGSAGENDVDGGKTTLVSPVFDMSEAESATLSYWRWYTNDLGNNPGQDYWKVEVSSNGLSWVALENTLASDNSWTEHTFNLGDYITLTGTVQIRFIADDADPGSLVEAAVDDIMVSMVRPPSVAVEEQEGALVSGLGLCRPNPIGSGATLSYRLASRSEVSLELFDVSGRRVRTLYEGEAPAGEHNLSFESLDQGGRPIASGIYFVRMQTPELTQVRQVTVVR